MNEANNDTQVIVYSADWCAFCHAVKDYLSKKGVKYEERNVEHKPEYAVEAVQKSGQRGIPVVQIGKKIIVGFDRPAIEAALAA
jgi:glutaredoxin-like YruB-family protein